MSDVYDRNGNFFHEGETDLENPHRSFCGIGCYWTAPVGVPFKILHDLEERFYGGGESRPLVLPKGVWIVLRVGDAGTCTWLERLGDDYSPESRRTRDQYWSQRRGI